LANSQRGRPRSLSRGEGIRDATGHGLNILRLSWVWHESVQTGSAQRPLRQVARWKFNRDAKGANDLLPDIARDGQGLGSKKRTHDRTS